MKYKKSIIIIMFAIFLFAIAAVSASDMNETAIANVDDNQIELSVNDEITEDNLQTNENNILTQANNEETVNVSNELDVLSTNQSTYSELADEIGYGGNIELKYGYYTYDYGSISITSPCVIDGKGAVIDMMGSTWRAFNVYTSDVTIKNLTVINANVTGDGGAIFFSYNGTVTDCNFVNNNGGAVFFFANGESNSNVINCNFSNNKVVANYISHDGGGAVYFGSGGNVLNCNFVDNKATDGTWFSFGGAVYFGSEGNVINCNFTNNKAGYGGAIQFGGNCNVSNCNFVDNQAIDDVGCGGAIYIRGSGSEIIIDSYFKGNSAEYGGAIDGKGIVSNCTFVDNSAYGGGAINMEYGTVSNCNFVNNKADVNDYGDGFGGAIFFSSLGTIHDVRNCNFTDNMAYAGGAVFFWRIEGAVTNCNFTNNYANIFPDIFQGSVSINSTNVKVSVSKIVFIYNSKIQKPKVTLSLKNGFVLKEDDNYILKWIPSSTKKVGTYTIKISGIDLFSGTVKVIFKINKAYNPLNVKGKIVNVKFSKLKQKTQVLKVSSVVKFINKGQGTLTYNKVNGNKRITINKKSGMVTIKKGLKKGTYKVKVKIKANGNVNYKSSAFKTITFKIKIK